MFPQPSSWRIVRGDIVQVMTGKDKGKQGEVIRVVRDQRFPRVFVSGINRITRRIPKRSMKGDNTPGFSVRMEAPIHYSNVMLVDPLTKKPVRTYFLFEDQPPFKRVRKTRGKHATDSIIPWPQKWKQDLTPSAAVGEKDTRLEVVEEVTYDPDRDFTLELPSEHQQLRRINEERAAAAAKAKSARKQDQWRGYNRLLFASRAGAVGSGSSSSSTGARSGGRVPAGSSSTMRSFSSSSSSSSTGSSCSTLSEALQPQGGSLLALLQRSPLCRSSSCGLGLGVVAHHRLQRLSWCGLAAAPLLLLL